MDAQYLLSKGTSETRRIVVDSRTRDVSIYPNSNEYSIDLNEPLQNVLGFELVRAYIPPTDTLISNGELKILRNPKTPTLAELAKADAIPIPPKRFQDAKTMAAWLSKHFANVGYPDIWVSEGLEEGTLVFWSDEPFVLYVNGSLAGALGFSIGALFGEPLEDDVDDDSTYIIARSRMPLQCMIDAAGWLPLDPDPEDPEALPFNYGRVMLTKIRSGTRLPAKTEAFSYNAGLKANPTEIDLYPIQVPDGGTVRVSLVDVESGEVAAYGEEEVSNDHEQGTPVTFSMVSQSPMRAGNLYTIDVEGPEDAYFFARGMCGMCFSLRGERYGTRYKLATPFPAVACMPDWEKTGTNGAVVVRCMEVEQQVTSGSRDERQKKSSLVMPSLEESSDLSGLEKRPFLHPIGRLTTLTLRLERLDGTLYATKGQDHVLIFDVACAKVAVDHANLGNIKYLYNNYDPADRFYAR